MDKPLLTADQLAVMYEQLERWERFAYNASADYDDSYHKVQDALEHAMEHVHHAMCVMELIEKGWTK